MRGRAQNGSREWELMEEDRPGFWEQNGYHNAGRPLAVRTGYDPHYGARPPKRAIQKKIETPLGRLLLKATVHDGQTVVADAASETGDLTFRAEAANGQPAAASGSS